MAQPPDDPLQYLLDKYGVHPSHPWRLASAWASSEDAGHGWTLVPGDRLGDAELSDQVVPLLPWRAERRFVELKRLIEERTVAPLVMCRLARFTGRGDSSLDAVLYRMFDLCQWLAGDRIVNLFASFAENGCGNVLAKLAGGVLCSIEVAASLPAGSPPIDRHELIARRGVASDRGVDTQVPQSSVYLRSENRQEQFTDTDAELFGLPPDDVSRLRAAFQVLADPQQAGRWRQQHVRLRGLVQAAFTSDRLRQRVAVEGV